MLARIFIASILALSSSAAMAQSSQWYFYKEASGVDVYYAVRLNSDEARVSWKCVNKTAEAVSCSVGAGQNKVYRCVRDGTPLGFTEALGERASVQAQGEYAFPSEPACKGKGANQVEPYGVQISIED
jgi:hypothetical protein